MMLIIAMIPLMNVSVHGSASKHTYLIITTEDLKSGFQNFRIGAIVKTLDDVESEQGGRGPEKIRAFIHNRYYNDSGWNLTYVLLGGDADEIPVSYMWYETGLFNPGEPPQSFQIPADMYYGCLDGDFNSDNDGRWGEVTDNNGDDVDFDPEVYVGRACVSNMEEVNNFIQKTVTYASNKASQKEYLTNILGVGEQLKTHIWGGDKVDNILALLPTNESNGGYKVTRIYEKPPNYPDEDDPIEWNWGLVAEKINNGTNFLIHDGHGSTTDTMNGWHQSYLDFNNVGMPFFLYSSACKIGEFDEGPDGDCWAEYMGPKNENGAFALVVSSDKSPAPFVEDFAEKFWSYAQGQPLGKALMMAKKESYNMMGSSLMDPMRMVLFEMNLLGDPAMNLADPPPRKPPTADFTIEPSRIKVNKTVYFNSTSYDNDEHNQSITNWTWHITFNSSDNGESNSADNPDGPFNYGDETLTEFYNYNENFTYCFHKKGLYDVSLTVTDDEGSSDTESKSGALVVYRKAILYANYVAVDVSDLPDVASPYVWLPGGVSLLDFSFIYLVNPPPDNSGSGGSSSGSGSGSGSEPSEYDPVTILYLNPDHPVSVDENETVEFSVGVVNGSGDNYIIFDFGDGETYSDNMEWSTTFSHMYTEEGTYYPDIEVHDLESYHYDYNYDFTTIAVSQNNNNP